MKAKFLFVFFGLSLVLLGGCATQDIQTFSDGRIDESSIPSRPEVFQYQPGLIAKDCSETLSDSSSLNSFELFLGMANCYEQGRELDAAFLLLIAQNRAMSDLGVFQAKDKEAELAAAELYGFIFYQAGGLGPKNIYRDEAKTKELVNRFKGWRAVVDENYYPGWDFVENPRYEIYQTLVSESREHRIAVIERHSTLITNEEYFALSNRADEIRAKNAYVSVGTEDYEMLDRLDSEMAEIANRLVGPYPQRKSSIEYQYRPNPDADFQQVFVAGNGRAEETIDTFTSSEQVAQSWLARALSTGDLKSVLEKIDFKNEILVSFSLGEQRNATGKIYITDLEIDSSLQVSGISVNVGVLKSECEYSPATMYPFALAIVERDSATSTSSTFRSRSNFGDVCEDLQSITPTN